MNKAILRITHSLDLKIMLTVVIAILSLLIYMEMTTFYSLKLYKARTLENYENSIRMNFSFWENSLNMINREILLLSDDSAEPYFWYLCNSGNVIQIETSKIMIQKTMRKISQLHENKFMIFVYMPERDIYIRSNRFPNEEAGYSTLDSGIKTYIKKQMMTPSLMWQYLNLDGMHYFIQIFPKESGFVGAVIPSDEILKPLIQQMGNVALIENGIIVYQVGNQIDDTDSVVSLESSFLPSSIRVAVSESRIYDDYKILLLIAVSVVIMALMVIAANIRIEQKVVINPLKKLREAMDQFRRGELDIRLEENISSDEINSLFQSFNLMAGQIMELKIDIYESELARQKIERSFLRIQIQPHFYSNILNLIHGLSQMGDNDGIQKITKNTSDYFRYLLSSKAVLVPLAEEVKCINNYCEIQKMRYPDLFDITVADGHLRGMIPPLIIQTFVENSIKHNVTLVPRLSIVVIIERLPDNCLRFVIEDNGLGFSPDILRKIRSDERIVKSGNHIGITNVKERLNLIYGGRASLKIESRPGATKVMIEITQDESALREQI